MVMGHSLLQRFAIGGWRLVVGDWRLAVGGWGLAIGGWRLAVGGWRLPVGGSCGLSLKAFHSLLQDSSGGWGPP